MTRTLALLPLLAGAALFVQPAAAADCAAAATDVVKAICADPEIKAADDAMTADYEGVLAKLPPDWAKALTANQAAWLIQREGNCSMEEGRKECLLDRIAQRDGYLTARLESGPGLTTPLLPFTFTQAQAPKLCAVDIAVHKFVSRSPGEAGFNDAVDAIMAKAKGEWSVRETTPDYQYECSYGLTSTVTYASPDLVAAEIFFDAYQGGAHGIYGRLPVVTDLTTGKTPDIAGLFDKAALTSLTATCTASLRANKVERYGEIEDPQAAKDTAAEIDTSMSESAETIAKTVADPTKWLIYEDRVEVYFEPYAVASYAEGDYTCTLPKAELQKLAGAKGWIVP